MTKFTNSIVLFIFSLVLSITTSQSVSYCGPSNKVKITETVIDSGLWWVEWMGHNNSVVFVYTARAVYRSADEGATWQDQSLKFGNQKVNYIAPSANESKMYFFQTSGPVYRAWTSEDEGNTIKEMTQWENFVNGYSFYFVLPHPREPDVALGYGPSQACNATVCYQQIWITRDFGKTWTFLDSYVTDFAWGKEYSDGSLYLIYSAFTDKTGRQQTKNAASLFKIDVRNPNGPKTKVFSSVNAFFKSPDNDSFLFVALRNPNGGVSLMVSENDGESWTLASFSEDLEENSYTLLDATEGAVFMNVMHQSNANYGNVYVSDRFGSNFALSLRNNKRGSGTYPFWGGADFIKVAGLEGIYVANVFDANGPIVNPDNQIRSVITFDMGGTWKPLRPPVNDSLGRPTCPNGQTDCNLNLFGVYELAYGRFYSVPGSLALVLAAGNVGNYLKAVNQEVNTYFSRDAGWTWEEIAKGHLTYEIADHGSLMILAATGKPTNNLTYSWNEGLSFETCTFTQNVMDVENIVVEPSFTSQKFILYGTRNGQGVLVSVDFTGIHQRECNQSTPGSPGSDYEYWSPSDVGFTDVKKECILGANLVYIRRKRDTKCFNPQEFEPKPVVIPCECTRQDYQCDYCFEPSEDGKTCVQVCASPPAPSDCKDYYEVSSGYRLIAGDRCVGGPQEYKPVKVKCPSPESSGTSNNGGLPAGAILAILVVVILSLVLVVTISLCLVVRFKKPEILYERLKNIKILQSGGSRNRSDYNKVGRLREEEDDPFIRE